MFQIAAAAAACAGGWFDFRTHKIPNWLTVSCMAAGLLLRTAAGGWDGLLQGLGGWAVGSAFILLWLAGGLKAGDVKLYMAVGALGGWKFCLNTEIYSMIFGGAAALILFIRRKTGLTQMKQLWLYVVNLLMTRNFVPYHGGEKSYFCFGWLIGMGALAAMLWPVF